MYLKGNVVDYYGMTDAAVLKEIGRRLKRTRLDQNITQIVLAEESGLSRSTIVKAEHGEPIKTLHLIQILRALNKLDGLDSFIPDPGVSPIQLVKLKGKIRARAHTSRVALTVREDGD
jgi:transcriptional regulator with XRE-family HTH domain